MSPPSQSYTRNCLLDLMSADDFALLQPHLQRVKMQPKYCLSQANQIIEHVFFLEGGVGSIVATQEGGNEIEVGLFGREGMSGSSVLLGVDSTPHRSFIQVDGSTALRMGADKLRGAMAQSVSLQAFLFRYVQVLSIQAAQTAACNAHYTLPERLARWLLMCHDRVDGDEISLTHEFMAMMLAVRRSGVTMTLHMLEGTGAIGARRGLIKVTDRERLVELAGDSYGVAEVEYRRLIGPFGKSAAPMLRAIN
jgi:CRP-like cAMP-binding protein